MPQNALSETPVVPAIPSSWNTRQLGSRFGVDIASAATAGALTCPAITVIDRAIIEKAAKGIPIRQTLSSCFRSMISHPGGFFLSTPFLLIYTLYTSTYLTANAIDTVTSTLRNQSFSTVFPGTAKFITTTTVNMGICVYKDARFARIFGANPPPSSSPSTAQSSSPSSQSQSQSQSQSHPRLPPQQQHQQQQHTASCHPPANSTTKVPRTSFALFCLRDSITIFASFNVPALVSPWIPDMVASTPRAKSTMAQFACPALMQFASTPMHLLGLDLYNRQDARLGWRERALRIRRDYVPSCFARMGKIVPAYGVGGVANVRLREWGMKLLEGESRT